ncbi:branched-chain amino acid transport system II carrier protein [Lacticaseibacillus hegangensis]|uniref:Branched-chain amino acid transport system carrier protein n=1 Tax=Lacticaseibacillus hegangensis TaxID=2486010 RepID=A0ABW4CZ13_9LACO|nr:branched-chain amino acid transport system II carrier protein [Lacticaseibacillus hegangensis]
MANTNPKLTKRQYITLGSMLFGLFFGAGNLIFPIHLGQLAGGNWLPATLGFLLSAVMLPLLAILAISMTESDSMFHLARPVGRGFALFFLIATHASLGLLIATPRTATVAFEMAVQPFIGQDNTRWWLLGFTALYFAAAYFFSRKPSKMTDYVGKILNPLLLLLLASAFIAAFLIKGDGGTLLRATHATAAGSNLTNGFLQGYNTMDALAGLGFGVTIVTALGFFGVNRPLQRSKDVAKVGALAMGLEAIIYALLIALGVLSLNFTKLSANGGPAFTAIMTHYTGLIGTGLLAAMTLLACLTSAIGLVTSLSQDLGHRFPKIGFKRFLPLTCTGSFIIANFGLNDIITLSTPVLMLLYPLAIALIVLGILHPFIGKNPIIYKTTVFMTLIPAVLDALHSLYTAFPALSLLKGIDAFASTYIPLFNISMDFLPFMLIGLIGGTLIAKLSGQPLRDQSYEALDSED